ncbi:hypothetical protein MNBD_GAMMA10-171 [hydrothermal vent metagenome]|uniref:LPS-assembly lipoprotein LptE n=1 Tax=hydrothermal vent metagenome TaxID=652676 RepID=A0A3B0XUG7_9ZZZZ
MQQRARFFRVSSPAAYSGASYPAYWLVGLLCTVLLSGCGFKLRGAYQLPEAMQITWVETAQPKSDFIRRLKRGLKSSGAQLVDKASDNVAVLKIFNEKKTKRIVSLDANGRAREYTLIYAVSFSVKALLLEFEIPEFEIPEQTVQIERDFVFDTEDVLGNSREEVKLYQEMEQDTVRLMLLRLQSKAKQ